MKLLVGLGNPGPSYAGHRHNVGFMVVQEIARRHGFPAFGKKFQGLCALGKIPVPVGPHPNPLPEGEGVLLLLPQTYMNLSGGSVQAAAAFYKIPPADIIVFHDELDLPPGKIRVKKGGGNGGHNGLKSIDAALGVEYTRVRIGIGHPGHKDLVSDYVLSNFTKDEKPAFARLIDVMAEQVGLLITGDAVGFVNRVQSSEFSIQ